MAAQPSEIPHAQGGDLPVLDITRLAGGLLVLSAALAWSTAGLFTRIVSTDIPTTLFWRALSGGACVLAIAAWSGRKQGWRALVRVKPGDVAVAGFSAAGMVCYISAFFFTTIANVSFLYGTMPLVTLVLSALILKERPGAVAILCCALCAAGVGLMTGGRQDFGDLVGMALAFGMTVCFAALTIAAKRFPDIDVMRATWLTGFMAAAATAPFARFSGVAPADYMWLVLYGVVNIGFGFGFYLLGAKRIPAVATALIGLVEIPLAPVWAYFLFGEINTPRTFIGGGVILLAAIAYLTRNGVAVRRNRRRARDALLR